MSRTGTTSRPGRRTATTTGWPGWLSLSLGVGAMLLLLSPDNGRSWAAREERGLAALEVSNDTPSPSPPAAGSWKLESCSWGEWYPS